MFPLYSVYVCIIHFKVIFRTFLALPKPVGLFPLDKTFGGKDVVNQENVVLQHVKLTTGPDGKDCLDKSLIIFFVELSDQS